MRPFLKGSFLLPLFFFCFNIYAQDSLGAYYQLFYQGTKEYSKWLETEKNDHFKEIFAELYRLPQSSVRKYSRPVKFKELDGISGKTSYLYIYIEAEQRMSAGILFYGIEKGEVSVNGSRRGKIDLQSDRGYALLQGTYEKGVYFISVKINEKNKRTGITVLSDKKLKISEKRGFTRDAASSLEVKNLDSKDKSGAFSRLFSTFCFPHTEEAAGTRETFFDIVFKNPKEHSKKTLVELLISSKNDKKSLSELKKLGFSDKNLNWWQEHFLQKGVCEHE